MKNMTETDSRKKLISAFGLVFFYSCLSLVYFSNFDHRFYVKNVLNCGIIFGIPALYILLTALFAYLYKSLLKQRLRDIAYPVIAMVSILPLFYFLADLKIGTIKTNPFSWNRGIFEHYAAAYFLVAISFFSFLCGLLFRRLLKKDITGPLICDDSALHNLIFHAPVFIYFLFIILMLLSNGFILHAAVAIALFFLTLSFENIPFLLRKLKDFFVRFARNEKLFLTAIFVIAFFVRYLWGLRLLSITGDKFIFASDDGCSYDMYATILAQGKALPSLPPHSGFLYWYFLAFFYKVLGLQNFNALIILQAAIGSSVPVGTYVVAKKIFKSAFVPAAASIFTCFDMMLIFLSVVIGMEAIYIPLTLLALIMTVSLLSSKSLTAGKAFLLGILFGLSYLARPPELLLFPAITALIAFMSMRREMKTAKILAVITSLLVGFALLLSIQYVTNYISYGKGGIITELQPVCSFESPPTWEDENYRLGQMGFNPFSDFKKTLSVTLRHPLTVSKLIIAGGFKRLILLWFFPNFGVFDPMFLVNPASGYFFRYPVYFQGLIFILMLFGIFEAFAKKENLTGLMILGAFLVYRSMGLSFFFVLNARYRSPFIPLCALFAAYGIEIFCKRVKASYHTI